MIDIDSFYNNLDYFISEIMQNTLLIMKNIQFLALDAIENKKGCRYTYHCNGTRLKLLNATSQVCLI